jgi:hypothetical protein
LGQREYSILEVSRCMWYIFLRKTNILCNAIDEQITHNKITIFIFISDTRLGKNEVAAPAKGGGGNLGPALGVLRRSPSLEFGQ